MNATACEPCPQKSAEEDDCPAVLLSLRVSYKGFRRYPAETVAPSREPRIALSQGERARWRETWSDARG
jgi:hypothetical protein